MVDALMISFHNVHLSYQGDVTALHNISLEISKGEFVFVTGVSGAGKSSLLKLIYADHLPSKGHVIVDSQNLSQLNRRQIPYLRRSIGVVFQDFKLLQHRTVFENVAITLEVLGWSPKEQGKKVLATLKQLGIDHRMNHTPMRLSGGEQQRVALARALVNDPKILLADEPTGNLDDDNKNQIMSFFRDANIRGTTVLIATHDKRLIDYTSRRVLTLANGSLLEDSHGQ